MPKGLAAEIRSLWWEPISSLRVIHLRGRAGRVWMRRESGVWKGRWPSLSGLYFQFLPSIPWLFQGPLRKGSVWRWLGGCFQVRSWPLEMEGLLALTRAWPLCRLVPCVPGCSGLRLLSQQHLWVGGFSQVSMGRGHTSALRQVTTSPHPPTEVLFPSPHWGLSSLGLLITLVIGP